jgi:hypothetical protein
VFRSIDVADSDHYFFGAVTPGKSSLLKRKRGNGGDAARDADISGYPAQLAAEMTSIDTMEK